MMQSKYQRLKLACYSVSSSTAVTGNLPPLLFLTFRAMYGISYSQLGLLILINFLTQLSMDLTFSFFSHRFNISKTVKFIPVLTFVGLVIYAVWPFLFPQSVYIGLVIGTIVFSAASGLVEVLISPVIAAIPSENPDREMSKLHSVYAWGVVVVIFITTLFILIFGSQNWQWLVLLFTSIPVLSTILYFGAEIPQMETPKRMSGALQFLKNKGVWLCIIAIFLGGSAECTMAQWSSGYLEQALNIPKVWGDIFGVALFGLTLGLGRTFYAKAGKNIERVMFWGTVGATLCYLVAAVTSHPIAGLLACAFTGYCTAMLWPGSLIVASDRFPEGGVLIYALMAAGGDLGASVGPQLVGIATDFAMSNQTIISAAQNIGLMPEQLGMKIGMLIGMLFPLIAIPFYFHIWNFKKKNS